MMYADGRGVDQDYAQAAQWFEKAAEEFSLAVFMLGQMYALGLGVPHDYAKAAQYFQEAEIAGDWWARALLGLMYVAGKGVPHDRERGCVLLREAYEYLDTQVRTIVELNANSEWLADMWNPVVAQLTDLHNDMCLTETDIPQDEAEKRLREYLANPPEWSGLLQQ